jgi:hypothetical protein
MNWKQMRQQQDSADSRHSAFQGSANLMLLFIVKHKWLLNFSL